MEKLVKRFKVLRKVNGTKRSHSTIAIDLETAMVFAASDLLCGNVDKDTHLQVLADCAAWVQRHYAAVASE